MGKREAWLHTWPALRRPLLPLLRYPRAKRFAAGGHEALYECLVCTCPGLGWVGFTPLEEEEGPRARALLFEDTARRQPSAGGKSTLARHSSCWYLGPGHPVRRTMRKTITFGCLGHQSMVCCYGSLGRLGQGVIEFDPQKSPRKKETQRLRESETLPQVPQPGAGRQT